jgi:hypothetical protein
MTDYIGQVINGWTVISQADVIPGHKPLWFCDCSCGRRIMVDEAHLRTLKPCNCGEVEQPKKTRKKKNE